jgi:hypothetical protein
VVRVTPQAAELVRHVERALHAISRVLLEAATHDASHVRWDVGAQVRKRLRVSWRIAAHNAIVLGALNGRRPPSSS